jgi:hypothetical protein
MLLAEFFEALQMALAAFFQGLAEFLIALLGGG